MGRFGWMNQWIIAAVVGLIPAVYLGLTWESAETSYLQMDGFAALETVSLGNQTHFMTIRSCGKRQTTTTATTKKTETTTKAVNKTVTLPKNTHESLPVLLILHGGPGSSDIPFLHETDYLLEEHFVVVHYDQRSAGKSCRFEKNTSMPLSIQLHVDDTVELVHKLCKRFDQKRVYLLGGSWGSVLALNLAKQFPNLFHFVAVRGLLVDGIQNEILSRKFVLENQSEKNLDLAVPPYDDRIEELVYQRQLLHQVGGMIHACSENGTRCSMYAIHWTLAKQLLFNSPETSWGDLLRVHRCMMSSLRRMWPEVQQFNAYETTAATLDVPFLALHGRHDHCTAMELVEGYVDALKAPFKKLVWFEKSAHSPQREEPELFQRTIIETFLSQNKK